MAGTCSIEVRPDAAVIVGGVAAGGLQPIEAVDKLEKQLALVRGYLDSNRGQLQLLERVRTLRNSPARPQDAEPPFQVVQRLRAELPVNAPIDQILQRLIELGDRKSTRLNSSHTVISYAVFCLKKKNTQQIL